MDSLYDTASNTIKLIDFFLLHKIKLGLYLQKKMRYK